MPINPDRYLLFTEEADGYSIPRPKEPTGYMFPFYLRHDLT